MIGGVPLQAHYFLCNASAQRATRVQASNGLAKLSPTVKRLIGATETQKAKGNLDESVTNLATDSRRVVPGSLFFALPGLRVDGNTFVEEAIGRGAVAVVTEKPRQGVTPVAVIVVKDVRRALAEITAAFYEHPEKKLKITGITGTNGKSTVAILAQHLMGPDCPVGLIGTIRYDVGQRTFPAFRTTPEALDTFALMDQMRQANCRSAVMEVSSHGIDQKRIWGIPMDVAVFTNLTQDHLDYHASMEGYFAAKMQLFKGVGTPAPRVSLINIDDAWGSRLAREVEKDTQIVSFGKSSEAVVSFRINALSSAGAQIELHDKRDDTQLNISSSLLGAYNVYNLVAAILVARESGVTVEEVKNRLAVLPQVPGRMERIVMNGTCNILVDYAHTDDALKNALEMLRPITQGRIHIVFGCGGDRDRTKRSKMVKAARDGADFLYITSDNPRSEPLDQIFGDMREGLRTEDRVRTQIIRDRREAISTAIQRAEAGDCVLIAGKGHENFQEIEDALIPFDDRHVAREILEVQKIRSA